MGNEGPVARPGLLFEPGEKSLNFTTVTYRLKSPKVNEALKFVMMGDLHGAVYGSDNAEIVQEVRRIKPDLILFTGDMITTSDFSSLHTALRLTDKLVKIAPVYAVNGNHETGLRYHGAVYRKYMDRLRQTGAVVLGNRSVDVTIRNTPVSIYGLELPFDKYHKFRLPQLSDEEIRSRIGSMADGGKENFTILLAHNPQFMHEYLKWGADLVLSGHFHGGVIRFKNGRTLLSPYGFPFPKYGYGRFTENGHTGIVTAGLGEHWLPVRFKKNNPTEIVEILLEPGDINGT